MIPPFAAAHAAVVAPPLRVGEPAPSGGMRRATDAPRPLQPAICIKTADGGFSARRWPHRSRTR